MYTFRYAYYVLIWGDIMNRAERRKNDFKKAIRKEKLAHQLYGNIALNYKGEYNWYNNLHQYSKNKIHCSCGMCSCKSKNKGKRRSLPGNYFPSYNPPIRDKKQIERMNYEE